MKLDINDDMLKVELNPLEMLLCFRRSLSIPIERITEVSTEKPSWNWGAPGCFISYGNN